MINTNLSKKRNILPEKESELYPIDSILQN